MADALTEEYMSTSLLRVVERARREPEGRFHSLAHLLDVPALERAFHRLRADAAVGVDGVSKDEYGQALEANLEDLHRRLRTKRYRHQPLRRVHIPKGGGRTRPIGISAVWRCRCDGVSGQNGQVSGTLLGQGGLRGDGEERANR